MLRRVMIATGGGFPPAAYATLNPSDKSSGVVLSAGNLVAVSAGTDTAGIARSTVPLSGKRYFEAEIYSSGPGTAVVAVGVATSAHSLTTSLGYSNPNGWAFWGNSTGARHNGVTAISQEVSGSQIIGVAVDVDTGKMWLRRNGMWMQGDPASGANPIWSNLSGTLYAAACPWAASSGARVSMKFDPAHFSHAAPAGFSPLSAP